MDKCLEGATPGSVSGCAVRYLAPELIKDTNAPETAVSDTFSFGMLMLECITERMPFFNLISDPAVFHARIVQGRHPPRPDGQDQEGLVSDSLWDLMLCCWSIECERRPTMERVRRFLSSE